MTACARLDTFPATLIPRENESSSRTSMDIARNARVLDDPALGTELHIGSM